MGTETEENGYPNDDSLGFGGTDGLGGQANGISAPPAQGQPPQPSYPAGAPVSRRNPAKTVLKASLIAIPVMVVLWFVANFVIGFVAWQMGPSESTRWAQSAVMMVARITGMLLLVDVITIVTSGIVSLAMRD